MVGDSGVYVLHGMSLHKYDCTLAAPNCHQFLLQIRLAMVIRGLRLYIVRVHLSYDLRIEARWHYPEELYDRRSLVELVLLLIHQLVDVV